MACTRNPTSDRLRHGEIKACSIACAVPLTHHFGGDFAALSDWSRRIRHERDGCANGNNCDSGN